MLELTYNVVRKITKIDPSILDEVDKIENVDENVEKVNSILEKLKSNTKNLSLIFDMDFDTRMIFLSNMTTSHLIQIMILIAKHNYEYIKILIDEVNSNQENLYAKGLKEKLFLLYRISEYPDVFSNENFMIIYNTLKED